MLDELDNFLRDLIDMARLELTAKIKSEHHFIVVDLAGEDLPLLLGRNGELLNSLEYLANKVYGRHLADDSRIILDAGGYRAMREKELQLMAKHVVERVRTTKKPFTFEPMTPSERRIVHLALSEQHDVRTESHGEGDDRKVTVFPTN